MTIPKVIKDKLGLKKAQRSIELRGKEAVLLPEVEDLEEFLHQISEKSFLLFSGEKPVCFSQLPT